MAAELRGVLVPSEVPFHGGSPPLGTNNQVVTRGIFPAEETATYGRRAERSAPAFL